MIRSVEISGVYRCVENPLVFYIDEAGSVTGPATCLLRWVVTEKTKDGKPGKQTIKTKTVPTDDLIAHVKTFYG